jgi:hypothetical protein
MNSEHCHKNILLFSPAGIWEAIKKRAWLF